MSNVRRRRRTKQTNMQSSLFKVRLAGIAFVIASTLALVSVLVQRIGPELVQYGNLCGPTSSDPCYRPVLKGGFPFAYLFDTPGVSVEGKLTFVEDTLHLAPLLLDVTLYFTAILLTFAAVSRYRSVLKRGAKHADA
jgi:hypothetical protein